MAIKSILVTGSSGTIGTRLCEKLLASGYQLTGFDLRPNKWIEEVDGLTVIGDLLNVSTLERLHGDFDLIIHLAANARVYDTVVDPSLAKDNVDMVFHILEFARRKKIPKIVFASSREVYGDAVLSPTPESAAHERICKSPYAASKIAGEALVQAYNRCFGVSYIVLRFSNVYGMYDESDRVVPLFIRLTKSHKSLIVFGKDKLLDFTYIDDTVSGILKCIERFDKVKNDTFNIASGTGISISEAARLIKVYSHARNKIVVKGSRTGEVVKFVGDISKACRRLGFEPRTEIREGLERTVNWYSTHLCSL
jgi:UDP-glucose 4-epimerase